MVGPLEILALLFVIFVILGPKRIVNMARSLGKGATDFVGSIGDPNSGKDEDGDAPRRGLPPGPSVAPDKKKRENRRG